VLERIIDTIKRVCAGPTHKSPGRQLPATASDLHRNIGPDTKPSTHLHQHPNKKPRQREPGLESLALNKVCPRMEDTNVD
jgi:hypothetical protein